VTAAGLPRNAPLQLWREAHLGFSHRLNAPLLLVILILILLHCAQSGWMANFRRGRERRAHRSCSGAGL